MVELDYLSFDGDNHYYEPRDAFTRYIDDEWGFAYDGRCFAAPIMSLLDPAEAVKDLEWALSRGARIVGMRPGPQGGKSPADPVFDAFWSRVNEARISVAFHVG